MQLRVFAFLLLPCVFAGVLLAQTQPVPAPPDCQAQLGAALNRLGTLQTLASQDREAVITYFQQELRKVLEERDALRKQGEGPK